VKAKQSKKHYVLVRFLQSPAKTYTYWVAKPVKIGDLLVVENAFGTGVVVVIQLAAKPDVLYDIKQITKKVAPL
jgi:CxxC motif-containing protein